MAELVLGIVADDFTGASDAASFLVSAGLPTLLYSGIPRRLPEFRQDTAIVIALKTRTAPVRQAVQESLAAFQWLKAQGAKKLYLKYCSTFDSTKDGNIGPVVDAVMDRWGFPATVLCPSLPVNGRTVKSGCLYVYGTPLAQSPMKDHPLTPMKHSHIQHLMEQQAKYRCGVLSCEQLCHASAIQSWQQRRDVRYWIPDYYEEAHGDRIAEVFDELPFLTGGSGLAGALARRIVSQRPVAAQRVISDGTPGKALILAGSCSKATLEQVAAHIHSGSPAYQLCPERLSSGLQSVDTLWEQVAGSGGDVLVYSSAAPEALEKSKLLGQERIAAMIEQTLSQLAALAVQNGFTRIIAAGGETSGAITKALGYSGFSIGQSVAPGVPVLIPLENRALRLVLKSGNFGQRDFFHQAIQLTKI